MLCNRTVPLFGRTLGEVHMQKAAAWDRPGVVGRRVAALSDAQSGLLVVWELLSMNRWLWT